VHIAQYTRKFFCASAKETICLMLMFIRNAKQLEPIDCTEKDLGHGGKLTNQRIRVRPKPKCLTTLSGGQKG